MKITFLGTGTSQGIPVIACDCHVCQSNDEKDTRLRCSVMISHEGLNYVIDTGPDFRYQMLREDVQSLEAVIYTHEHKDHIAGLDDVRAFNYRQKKDMDLYGSELVEVAIRREFFYAFEKEKYPGVPKLKFHRIDSTPFTLGKLTFTPIEVMHFKLPVHGFRVKDFTYITDAKTISDSEMDKVRGTKVLVLNALREKDHVAHMNLKEALAFVEEIQPEQAYFTHVSHLFDRHESIESRLPDNVHMAYDGLVLDLKM